MKKLFTLVLAVVATVTTRATDYNVPVTVSVNGVTSTQPGTFIINENDGLYDISLKNFILQSEDGPMGVGNVELKGIKPYQDGNATLLVTADNVTITPGDDPSVIVWLANMLPPVYVELLGKIEGEHLRCFLDIDLTETLEQVIQVAIGDGYQIANQSFETWHASSETSIEPDAWHSFDSASGIFASLVGNHIEKSDQAHSGEASARISSSSILGIIANGTMTTGRMNAGAMIALDPANHAYIDMSMTDVDGNGDPFYTPMYATPDSIVTWMKFSQGKPNADHPYASISAVITDGTRYQDPEDKAYTNVVAKAKNAEIATTDGQWRRVAVPFVYSDNAVEPKAVLVTVTTNADPGQGSGGDEVLIDDIEFIYNAKATALKIKGHDVPEFTPTNFSYEMELNEEISADDIEVTVDGKKAHVLKKVTIEDNHYLCSVIVISADMSASTIYLVSVKSSATGIRGLKPVASQQATYYTLDGRLATTLHHGTIYICRQADGTVTKICY